MIKENKEISIVHHCIPASDFISKTEKAAKIQGIEIPWEFQNLEEKTAGGVVSKAIIIANSNWYKTLITVSIKSGKMEHYIFYPNKEKENILQVLNDLII